MGEFGLKDLEQIANSSELMKVLVEKEVIKEKKFIQQLTYEQELKALQYELVKFQHDVIAKGRRVLLIFEGRDAAGKGGSIKRFLYNIDAKKYKVVALDKPTEKERGQWYFQRYLEKLPNQGEISFFDRSWYNRAVVEPVFGFCSEKEHDRFIEQVVPLEEQLIDDGVEVIKFFLNISKEEQEKRLDKRRKDPLKSWKIGSLDEQAQEKWEDYTKYIDKMLKKTSSKKSPWVEIETDDKKTARLNIIKYTLNCLFGQKHVLDSKVVKVHN